jgi:hypothetical protein
MKAYKKTSNVFCLRLATLSSRPNPFVASLLSLGRRLVQPLDEDEEEERQFGRSPGRTKLWSPVAIEACGLTSRWSSGVYSVYQPTKSLSSTSKVFDARKEPMAPHA